MGSYTDFESFKNAIRKRLGEDATIDDLLNQPGVSEEEVFAAVEEHSGATTDVHGIADTSTLIANPMTNLGDIMYGGDGVVTGYTNRATTADGAVAVSALNSGGVGVPNVVDGDDTTFSDWGDAGDSNYNYLRIDLQTARRIGRFRVKQTDGVAQVAWTGFQILTASSALTSPTDPNWTLRYTTPGNPGVDTGHVVLSSATTARYWLFKPTGISHAGGIRTYAIELDEVATVGSGNATRLAPPPERRVMVFDPDNGVPAWQTPATANPDTSGADLATLETEINQLKALLRAAGLLSG